MTEQSALAPAGDKETRDKIEQIHKEWQWNIGVDGQCGETTTWVLLGYNVGSTSTATLRPCHAYLEFIIIIKHLHCFFVVCIFKLLYNFTLSQLLWIGAHSSDQKYNNGRSKYRVAPEKNRVIQVKFV
jgi:hypothetical protein